MNPPLFFFYSAIIGFSIPATAAIIVTVLDKNKSNKETTPTILTGKLSDSGNTATNDIPKEILPYLETTNSPFTHNQLSSENLARTLSEKLKKEFPLSSTTVSCSSSNTPTHPNKEKNVTSEIGEK